MGRPFLEKFNDVKYVPCTSRGSHVNDRPARWEVQDDHLKAWEQGRTGTSSAILCHTVSYITHTGFPIVDAAMRQCNQMGELRQCQFKNRVDYHSRMDAQPIEDDRCHGYV
jgi:hypothetical protein